MFWWLLEARQIYTSYAILSIFFFVITAMPVVHPQKCRPQVKSCRPQAPQCCLADGIFMNFQISQDFFCWCPQKMPRMCPKRFHSSTLTWFLDVSSTFSQIFCGGCYTVFDWPSWTFPMVVTLWSRMRRSRAVQQVACDVGKRQRYGERCAGPRDPFGIPRDPSGGSRRSPQGTRVSS